VHPNHGEAKGRLFALFGERGRGRIGRAGLGPKRAWSSEERPGSGHPPPAPPHTAHAHTPPPHTATRPPNTFPMPPGVSAIALGESDTCAIEAGGGVKCWGWNGYGQLGIGSTSDETSPVAVPGDGERGCARRHGVCACILSDSNNNNQNNRIIIKLIILYPYYYNYYL
jgi:alpha-tubulin suppressor-like RCC1 family protein